MLFLLVRGSVNEVIDLALRGWHSDGT